MSETPREVFERLLEVKRALAFLWDLFNSMAANMEGGTEWAIHRFQRRDCGCCRCCKCGSGLTAPR